MILGILCEFFSCVLIFLYQTDEIKWEKKIEEFRIYKTFGRTNTNPFENVTPFQNVQLLKFFFSSFHSFFFSLPFSVSVTRTFFSCYSYTNILLSYSPFSWVNKSNITYSNVNRSTRRCRMLNIKSMLLFSIFLSLTDLVHIFIRNVNSIYAKIVFFSNCGSDGASVFCNFCVKWNRCVVASFEQLTNDKRFQ